MVVVDHTVLQRRLMSSYKRFYYLYCIFPLGAKQLAELDIGDPKVDADRRQRMYLNYQKAVDNLRDLMNLLWPRFTEEQKQEIRDWIADGEASKHRDQT